MGASRGETAGVGGPTGVVLSRLERVVSNGAGKWMARCPAHNDKTASLSVKTGDDGRALLNCFGGCEPPTIAAAIGLEMKDLFLDRPVAISTGGVEIRRTRELVARYPYVDEDETLVFEVLRYEPKDFRQRRPDGAGGWISNLDGVRAIPFALPTLIEAIALEKRVYIVEGEKDALRLTAHDRVATTNAGGVGGVKKWETFAPEFFFDAIDVVLLPDNDDAGRKYAATIASLLVAVGANVRIVALPGVAEKGDVSDWLAGGGTMAALDALVESTPYVSSTVASAPPAIVEPPRPAAGADVWEDEPTLTDLGNAARLVRAYGDDLRYVDAVSRWYFWDGRRWQPDKTRTVEFYAKRVTEAMYEDALRLYEREPNTFRRNALLKWAEKSSSDQRIRAMIARAAAEPAFARRVEDFDRNRLELTLENVSLDLGAATLEAMARPHRRDDNSTKLAPVTFDPAARAPRWLEFLLRIFPGHPEIVDYLQEALGYSLTGETAAQCVFFAVGKGQNGKSTLLETFRELLGDYAATAEFTTFIERKSEVGPRHDLASLEGARFVLASEVPSGVRLAESQIKDLTGGGKIRARQMYQESTEFLPECKVWFGTNHKPVIRNTDRGIWRRIRIIPFDFTIPDDERVEDFASRFVPERAGILNWALDGLVRYRERGSLRTPAIVESAAAEYKTSSDLIGLWLDECTLLDGYSITPASELYRSFSKWLEDNGERPISARALGMSLEDRGIGLVDNPSKRGGRERLGIRVAALRGA